MKTVLIRLRLPDQRLQKVQETNKAASEQNYQWDAFGNPQSNPKNGNTVNNDNNDIVVKHDQLQHFSGNDYRFDDCGNQISCLGKDNKQQRIYNGLNQLTQLNINGQLTHYEYDALG